MSAEVHVEVTAPLTDKGFRDWEVFCRSQWGAHLLTLVLPAYIVMKKPLDCTEPQFPR